MRFIVFAIWGHLRDLYLSLLGHETYNIQFYKGFPEPIT